MSQKVRANPPDSSGQARQKGPLIPGIVPSRNSGKGPTRRLHRGGHGGNRPLPGGDRPPGVLGDLVVRSISRQRDTRLRPWHPPCPRSRRSSGTMGHVPRSIGGAPPSRLCRPGDGGSSTRGAFSYATTACGNAGAVARLRSRAVPRSRTGTRRGHPHSAVR